MVAKKIWISDLKNADGEVRVLGKVTDKYSADNFASITVFDDSGKVQVRVFKEGMGLVEPIQENDVVDVFGVVKEYKGEKYVLPSIVRKAEEGYSELRKLELNNPAGERDIGEEVRKIIKEKDTGKGVTYEDISSIVGIDKERLQEAMTELLASGEIYEPKYGRYKLI